MPHVETDLEKPMRIDKGKSGGPTIDRRTAVAGAGVAAAAITAATVYSTHSNSEPTPKQDKAHESGATLANVGDVPVGGGIIVGDTVVTQPSAGSFRGLSTTCTHLGCQVNQVAGGQIFCPCHGSIYGLDGSVHRGPALFPLAPRPVHVEGSHIVAG